jgi:AraC family transcriptional regulator
MAGMQSNLVTKVLLYIDRHLDDDLSLEILAARFGYSAFHFHRLFRAQTAETLQDYIRRILLERSAKWLITQKPYAITDMAYLNGYGSNAAFTKALARHYGISPLVFRQHSLGRFSKIIWSHSNPGQAPSNSQRYFRFGINKLPSYDMDQNIKAAEVPALTLASIMNIGMQNLGAAYGRLLSWAGQQGLLTPDMKAVTVFHDSPKVMHPAQVRQSAGIVIDDELVLGPEVTKLVLPAGLYVIGSFEITMEEFESTWTNLFVWLNQNGFATREGLVYEIHHNDYRTHPEQHFIVEMRIPVVKR